jgi:hypothetical protein
LQFGWISIWGVSPVYARTDFNSSLWPATARRHEGKTFGGRSVATFDFHGLLPENGPVALHRAFFSPEASWRQR